MTPFIISRVIYLNCILWIQIETLNGLRERRDVICRSSDALSILIWLWILNMPFICVILYAVLSITSDSLYGSPVSVAGEFWDLTLLLLCPTRSHIWFVVCWLYSFLPDDNHNIYRLEFLKVHDYPFDANLIGDLSMLNLVQCDEWAKWAHCDDRFHCT